MQKETAKTPKKAAAKKDAKPAETKAKTAKAAAPKKAAVKKVAVKKDALAKKETAPKTTTKNPAKDTLVSVTFQLAYSTRFGQHILITGNVPQLGNGLEDNALKLQYADPEHWAVEVKLNKAELSNEGLKYYYIIQHEDDSTEKSAPYYLFADDLTKTVHVSDAWNYNGYIQNAFSTKVFETLNDKKGKKGSAKKGSHTFKVTAPELPGHYSIFLLGNSNDLGNWNADNIILLSPDEQSGAWTTRINITLADDIVEYKYGIYDLAENAIVAFEDGSNRTLAAADAKATLIIINDGFLRSNN